ncbi:MFS transporter [Mycobacterium yunnanensis]|uniref:MFS transporter n=1 Tax=Mycobacterium yunnanensis TaxID=368477 RepID=A0A9X3C3H9_9MYCO|nr:MFS transporter [Mycobacterium yunnanensis]MCV7422122.1 MFS transporter [Mycobacterium yunnanensis]
MLAAPVSVAIGAPSVALPSVAPALGVSFSATEWIISAWSLGAAVAMPLGGRIAQRWGLRTTLGVAVVTMAVGSIGAATAQNLVGVVGGRLFGGLGAGAMVICVYACIDQTLDRRGRVSALATVAVCQTTASGSGSLIGGLLTAHLGWRATMAVPAMALVALVPALRLTPGDADRGQRVDVTGAVLLSVLAAATITLLHSATADLPRAVPFGMVAVTICAATALVCHVRRHPTGFVPRDVVTAPGLLSGAVVGLTLFAGYYGVLSTAPELLARQHVSTLGIGLLLLPAAVCGIVTGPALAALWRRRRPLWQTTALLGTVTAIAALMAGWRPHPAVVATAVALATVGFAAAQVILVGRVRDLVDPADRATAAGLFNFMLYSGGSIGPALAGGLSAVSMQLALSGVAAVAMAGTVTSVLTRLRARPERSGTDRPLTSRLRR